MGDVFVSSLTSLWSNAPTRTLQRLIVSTKDLRRADASSTPPRAGDVRWTGGTRATLSHRQRLLRAYMTTLNRELQLGSWGADEPPPREDAPRGTRLDPQVSSFLRAAAIGASREIPSLAFTQFPNLMLLDAANLYLPVAFDGVLVGGPLVIGSAPRLADELRALAAFLGLDVSNEAWWRMPALVGDTPQKRSLYNLQVLAIACAESAATHQPVVIA